MKVRKLAIALALAGSMGSNLVYALGLGEAEIKSNLNEPLRAEIELVSPGDLTRDEIIASLAPERDFQRVGIEPIFFLNEMKFEVVKNGRGQLVLQVTTKRPVREPYLNFLVELSWPSGRLLREYALLVDPPVFRQQDGQSVAQSVPAAPPAVPRIEPRNQSQQAASARATAADTARSDSSPARQSAPSTYGPVSASDTLWKIAMEVRPSADLTPQQVMLALQDANPDAFLRNNINLVREGSVLRIPSEEAMRSRSRREAVQQVTAQNRRFQEGGTSGQEVAIDASSPRPGSEAAPAAAPAGDELRLVAGDSSTAETGSHGGDMGGSGEGSAESRLAISLEELDQTRRENEELSSRLEDLEGQLENMQRLLELKNDRLAALQAEAEAAPGDESLAAAGDAEVEAEAGSDAAERVAAANAENGETGGESEVATGETGGPDAGPAGTQEPMATDGEQVATEDRAGEPETVAEDQSGSALVSDTAQQAAEPASPAAAQPAAEERSAETADFTPGAIFQQIKENPTYQIGAGGVGVGLLGFLWFLARRNAKREENFYAQLQQEDGANNDLNAGAFATGLAAAGVADTDQLYANEDSDVKESAPVKDGDEDALAEAEVYIAYGRLDQAGQVLETGISQEPSRTDLRLKLMEVYADSGNEEAFARQFGELEALEDESAIAQAESLRGRLDAQASGLSIDDLESQLRADVGRGASAAETTAEESDDDLGISWSLDEPETEKAASDNTVSASDFDFESELAAMEETPSGSAATKEEVESLDFDQFELESHAASAAPAAAVQDEEPEDHDELDEVALGAEETADDSSLDFSLDEDDLEADLADEDRGVDLSDEELDALDLDDALEEAESADDTEKPAIPTDEALKEDLDALETAQVKEAEAEHQVAPAAAETGAGGADFDDSFLEELDAELERVAEEDGEELGELADADDLDDLELDVSDEDLALIEEVAGADSEGSAPEQQAGSEPEPEVDFAALAGDEAADEKDAEAAAIPRLDAEDDESGLDGLEDFDDSLLEDASPSMADLDESDLDNEDDFDFLEGTDEAATKLDLARAYMEMGDAEGARDILGEVSLEGSDEQKKEAEALLKTLG